jgi:hypothetical protein
MTQKYPLIGLNYIDHNSQSTKDWTYQVGVSFIADVLYTILTESVKSMIPGPDDTTIWNSKVFEEYVTVAIEQYSTLTHDITRFKEDIISANFKYVFDYTIKIIGTSTHDVNIIFVPLKDVDSFILEDIISIKIDKIDGNNLFVVADRMNKATIRIRFAYLDHKRNAYIVYHKLRILLDMVLYSTKYIHIPIYKSKKDYDLQHLNWYSNPLIRAEIVETKIFTGVNGEQSLKKIVIDTISTLSYSSLDSFKADLIASNEFEEAIISVYIRKPKKNVAYSEHVEYRNIMFYYHSSQIVIP